MKVRFRTLYPTLLLTLAVLAVWSSRFITRHSGESATHTMHKLNAEHAPAPLIHNKLKGLERKAASVKWFTEQRTYPFGFIPQDAEIRALEDVRKRMIPELQSKGVALAKSSAAQLNWEFVGPGNIGGRLRGLLVHPNNPNLLYVGSASGGVWKSTDGGTSWSPTMNDLITLNISALVFKPDDPNTIYAGTGEGFLSDGLPGRGVLKTTDGGQNWTRISAANGLNSSFITELAVSPANPNVIYAASREAVPQYLSLPTETTPDPGVSAIFRSTDAGQSWQNVTSGKGIDLVPNFPFDNMATDVVVSPTDANVVYGAFGVYFESGGIWKSTNGGQSWTRLTNGLPNPASANQGYGRIELAMSPSNPSVLYASFTYRQKQGDNANLKDEGMLGIWKTTDAGQTWSQVTTPQSIAQRNIQSGLTTPLGQQGNYDNAIIVHPTDPNTVFVAGLDIYKSTNGGNSWSQVSFWIGQNPDNLPYVHADHHVFAFDRSTNPPTLYNGSDGGIARTRDLGTSWDILNRDLGVTQFYYLAVHPTNPSIMFGGAQDNGTPTSFDGNRNNWFDLTTGDGGPSYFDYNNPTTFYASVYRVNMTRYFNIDFASGTGQTKEIGFTDGSNGITQDDVNGAAFFAPYEISPNNPNTLVLGTNRLLKTTNQGDSWTPLTNALNVPIVAVAIAEGSDNIIWLATKAPQQGKAQIFKTENGGGSFTDVTSANLPDRFVTDIEFDPSNNRTVYLTYSGYGTSHVFKSTNAGANWTDITNNLPDVPVNCAQVHPQQSNVIFIGTDIGVFTSEDGGQVWQPANNGLPTVQVVALVLNTNLNKIFAGTHGRGAYSAPLTGGGGTAVVNVDVQEVELQVRPGNIRTKTFNLSNTGNANLTFNIVATGPTNNTAAPPSSDGVLNNSLISLEPASGLKAPLAKLTKSLAEAKAQAVSAHAANASVSSALAPAQSSAADVLVLDDGNDSPDDFIGLGGTNDFYWMNGFQPSGFSFRLEAFNFYMRTENAFSNSVYVAVLDANLNVLVAGNLSLNAAPNGGWFNIALNNPVTFADGEVFYLQVGASFVIAYPAGADKNASVRNSSFFFNPQTNQYVPLGSISGFENGAFLIRAVGTKGGGSNQPPVARAQVAPNPANVNQQITFNASNSSDPDGQITQYLWNFGDGTTSTQQIATKSYTQANTYNVSLTVTDNNGATGQTTVQVTVNGQTSRLTVSPTNGTVAPNATQVITVRFDAQGLAEGNYQGQLHLTSNGGNLVIPVRILVSNNVSVADNETALPATFRLDQNYPNPFNPETMIRYALPHESEVVLNVFDMNGRQVARLAEGRQAPGEYRVRWDGRDAHGKRAPSGVYLYRFTAVASSGEKTTFTRKLTLMK